MVNGIAHDYDTVLEDLMFLDESGVGANQAAQRTGFTSAEGMEKWLERKGHTELWLRFKRRDPAGTHTSDGRRRQREKTTGNRVCSHCEVEKPLKDFYVQTNGRDGYMSQCIACNNSRPPTETRLVRQRARGRAWTELQKRHQDEFDTIYAHELEKARAEHAELKTAAAATGQHDAAVARLRPGAKRRGETVTDRLDVARCPSCHTHHDAGHECPNCGDTTPAVPQRVKPWRVRAWAIDQGLSVPTRGPIPEAVQAAYDAQEQVHDAEGGAA